MRVVQKLTRRMKKLYCALILLMCFATWIFVSFHGWNLKLWLSMDINKEGISSKSSNKRFILIMAGHRTGSSFTGSLFDINPDVFYYFEPLVFSERFYDDVFNQTLQEISQQDIGEHLWNLFNCNIGKFMSASRTLYAEEAFLNRTNIWIPRVFSSFRRKHTFLPDSLSNISAAEEICRGKSVIVIKTIRVKYIVDVLGIMKRNVSVFHLVRDPRASAYSAKSVNRTEAETHRLTELQCNFTSHNLVYQQNTQHNRAITTVLNRKYRLFRYEDLVKRPVLYTALIYRAAGLPMPVDVLNHVVKNPTVKTWFGSTDSVGRVKLKSVSRWMFRYNLTSIVQVEKKCRNMMRLLGYRRVSMSADNSLTEQKWRTKRKSFNPVQDIATSAKYILKPDTL